MRFRVGVFATIQDEQGRVLLGQRRNGDHWGQPGGGLEAGEAPWQGVVREVREETGLAVAVERLAGVYNWPHLDEFIFSFVCRVTGGTLATSDETRAVRYFPLDALPATLFREHADRIRDTLRPDGAIRLRALTDPSAEDELAAGKR